MMKKRYSFRKSLILNAVGVCMIVTISFVGVVSVIIGIQNEALSKQIFVNAFGTIQEELASRREKALAVTAQITELQFLSTAVNFITDYKTISDTTTYFTQDTYRRLAESVYNLTQASLVRQAAIYDREGDLVAFSCIRGDQAHYGYAMGFPHPFLIATTITENHRRPDRIWRRVDGIDGIAMRFPKKIPGAASAEFEEIFGIQSITASVPIFFSHFDPISETISEKPAGFVFSVHPLDRSFEKRVSGLTGTRVRVISEKNPKVKNSGLSPQPMNQKDLKHDPRALAIPDQILFSEVSIDNEPFYQGVLTVFEGEETAFAIKALYSKEFTRKNSWQMVRYLLLASLCSMLLIVPVAFFFSNRITAPVEALVKTAKAISAGDLDQRAPAFRNDEIGALGEAFNHMAEKLKHSMENLHWQIEEKKRLSTIIESTTDLVSIARPDGRVSYMNQAGQQMIGVETETIDIDTLHPAWAYQTIMEKGIPAAIEKGAWEGETALIGKDGKSHPVSQVILSHRSPEGDLQYLSTIMRDISARKEAEEELSRLRNFLSNIIDSMPSVLIGVDKDGLVNQWNKEAEKITGKGFKEALGKPLTEVYPQLLNQEKTVRQVILNRKPLKGGRIETRDGGEVRFSDVTIFPLAADGIEGAVIRVDDVTERMKIDEMMIQNEKMMSVGGLAAGMAHEINNPLAGILQNAQVLKNRIWGEIPANADAAAASGTTLEAIRLYMEKRNIREMVEMIGDSGKRAADIVRDMLSFSRKNDEPHSKISLVKIGGLIDKTIEMAEKDYDLKKKYDFRKIKIEKEYDPSLPDLPCEKVKIQQVILNILKNAAQAMSGNGPSGKSPQLILRTSLENQMARIEIEDNGPGMDEKTRKRIFEPFFTTKAEGVGTGLGLSVSYFIIKENHQGNIQVESQEGAGARFIIHLPLERQ